MSWKVIGVVIGAVLGVAGCAVAPTDAESARQTVLQYVGSDVGTAGPFGKGGKKELGVLSEADRTRAAALIDRGAEGFLIYAPAAAGTTEPVVGRIIFIQHGKIAGDFKATPPAVQATPAKPAGDTTGTSVVIPPRP